MKELDVVMSGYLEQCYPTASSQDQALFRDLLQLQDPELYALLLGRSAIDSPELERFVELLRAMSKSH